LIDKTWKSYSYNIVRSAAFIVLSFFCNLLLGPYVLKSHAKKITSDCARTYVGFDPAKDGVETGCEPGCFIPKRQLEVSVENGGCLQLPHPGLFTDKLLTIKNQEEDLLGTEIRRVHRGRQPVKFDVLSSVFEVFGDADKASKWLKSPCLAFRCVTPLSMLETSSGVEMVLNELERIEHEAFIAGMVF
jgi:hypothetical protein